MRGGEYGVFCMLIGGEVSCLGPLLFSCSYRGTAMDTTEGQLGVGKPPVSLQHH